MQHTNQSGQSVCANCQGEGKSACKDCLLVLYCGRDCQTAHWPTHKLDCKSLLVSSKWQPQWVTSRRVPAFIGAGGPSQVAFGGKKYLWGNMPAVDVLRLNDNEGESYVGDLHLLFAASGDLRNVVKTLAYLPPKYGDAVCSVINDLDFDIVARNTIILLVAMTSEDKIQAIESILHIWYSALLRPIDTQVLTDRVRPLVEEVRTKIKDKSDGTILGKTFTFGSSSIRLVLRKEQWSYLLWYLEMNKPISMEQAKTIRTAVTLAKERTDYRERQMISLPPYQRLCASKFREDGILLPFGRSREDFRIPNPTLFGSWEWPMKDDSDPLSGWDLPEILSTDAGPAKNDVYGKLYHYLTELFTSFYSRLKMHNCHFELFNLNATDLPAHLKKDRFARIEVSNISDGGYLGIRKTVAIFAPLLQSPSTNPHATLLTLFMNAVPEMSEHTADRSAHTSEITRVMEYMPMRSMPSTYMGDPQTLRLMSALPLVRDVNKYFNRYMEMQDFPKIEQLLQVSMKDPHTILDKWPLKLKLRPGQKGAKEEFDTLLSSAHVGFERYVEWKRTK